MLLPFLTLLFALSPDAHRPVYHFAPEKNWMNDPNGTVFYQGEYHLFFQHNPFANVWGHMTWGHAVSEDLSHWQQLPHAIPEEDGVAIFSGSAVVDHTNTSGFCQGPSCLVAIYTGHTATRQTQNLAYSNDKGRTWTKYKGNPVLDLGMKDFRDPKVFWHGTQKQWIMVVSLPREYKVRFYASADLKAWKPLSDFGPAGSDFGPAGSVAGIWECPDLFPLPVQGSSEQKWVLVVSVNPGGPAGGSAVQYSVGNFDEKGFHNENPADTTLWADHGKDFYAATSFSDIPAKDGRRIWLGWFSNWQYARNEPTETFRTIQSVPRELTLLRTPAGLRLAQQPIRELAARRTNPINWKNLPVEEANRRLANFHGESYEVQVEFEGDGSLLLRKGANEETRVGLEAGNAFIDRTRSGAVAFHKDFPGRQQAAVSHQTPASGPLRVLVDRSSVELFAGQGETVISDRIFPSPGSDGLQLAGTRIRRLQIWQLK